MEITSNPSYKSTYNLLRGLGRLISAVIIGAISALNLQVDPTPLLSPKLLHPQVSYKAC